VIEILKRPDDKLQSPYSCSTKVKRITLRNWLTRIIGKMSPASSGAPVSSASRRYTPSGNAAPTLPPITRSAYNGGGQSSSTALFQPHQTVSPIAGRQGQIAASGSVSHINSYVLFGVQGPRRTVTPGQIPTNNRSTDYDFFQGLKKCYQNQRGRLRLWFSIWRLENCDVVKVCYSI
jgi:hypothetical protein